jgi:hypothetical protein
LCSDSFLLPFSTPAGQTGYSDPTSLRNPLPPLPSLHTSEAALAEATKGTSYYRSLMREQLDFNNDKYVSCVLGRSSGVTGDGEVSASEPLLPDAKQRPPKPPARNRLFRTFSARNK